MLFSRHLSVCLLTAFLLAGVSPPLRAQANEPLLDRNLFSIGGGISRNEVGNDDDTGFQLFGAYDLVDVNLMEGVDSSVEFGIMDFGFDDDDTGIWGSFVVDGDLADSLGWLAQAGFDIGDDSGFLFGAGLKYRLGQELDLRFEYVVRDEVDSLQLNFLYHL